MTHYVVIHAGQSNANGQALESLLTNSQLLEPYPAVRFLYDISGNGLSSIGDLVSVGNNNYAGELTLGRELHQSGVFGSDDTVGIIKVSLGGKALIADSTGWTPTIYTDGPGTLVTGLKAAWDAWVAVHGDTKIIAVNWLQGESDGLNNRTTAQYKEHFRELDREFRSHVGASFFDDAFVWLGNLLHPGQTDLTTAQMDAINDAFKELSLADAQFSYLDTNVSGVSIQADEIHYTPDSLQILGGLAADRFVGRRRPARLVTGKSVDVYKGTTVDLDFLPSSRVPTDGATLTFTARVAGAASASITKTSDPATGGGPDEVEVVSEGRGTVRVHLLAADTSALAAGNYTIDVSADGQTEQFDSIVAPGLMRLVGTARVP